MEVYPPPMPYQVCKIEELRKNSKGSVEVAAKCFYRRKDLPPHLLAVADRHTLAVEEESEGDSSIPSYNNFDELSELERHLVRHRELFLSRQIETYKIDMVRGKCSVSLLNELEDVSQYLKQEDSFFYTMVYDPNQKTLLVDKGEIRVGTTYQAEVSPYIAPEGREEPTHLATQVWEPKKMPDHKVEQFLVVARSIGTFARALLDGAKRPQISLRLGAAAASRDITLFHAMDTLHNNSYDVTQATSCLVPRGPVLCADELEAWTQEEAKRFEDGLQEHKDFHYIQRKYLPWKPVKSIVAYYYMWKTTDRYQIQKRHRMLEKQNDLKEVIVHLRTPSGAPAGPRDLSGKAASVGTIPTQLPENPNEIPKTQDGEKGCESCIAVSALRWYQWGPAHEHCRLCNLCYTYWRKYGGLKLPTRWEMTDRRVNALAQPGAILQTRKRDRPPGQARSSKKSLKRDDKKSIEVIPPLPFYMIPTGVGLYSRHKLGTATLLKAARKCAPIDLKDVPQPTVPEVEHFLSVRRKGSRKPRPSEPTLVTLKLNVQQTPLKRIIPRPSPTPISPSYKAKTAGAKSAVGKVTTSGTYVPAKPQHAPLISSNNAAVYTPPNMISRKRRLEDGSEHGAAAAKKVPRPSSPQVLGPGEIFFRVDPGTKMVRERLGRNSLLKAARSPSKKIQY